jgi:hypothetical protein
MRRLETVVAGQQCRPDVTLADVSDGDPLVARQLIALRHRNLEHQRLRIGDHRRAGIVAELELEHA